MLSVVACNIQSDKKEYVGEYQLNITKSKMGIYTSDSNIYRNLKLSLTDNDSFKFSIDAPFINKSFGLWEIRSIDGIPWAYLQYGKGVYAIIEEQVGITKNGELYINSTRSKENLPNLERAVFDKISNPLSK